MTLVTCQAAPSNSEKQDIKLVFASYLFQFYQRLVTLSVWLETSHISTTAHATIGQATVDWAHLDPQVLDPPWQSSFPESVPGSSILTDRHEVACLAMHLP